MRARASIDTTTSGRRLPKRFRYRRSMNSGRGTFQGSCRWLSSLPSLFGFRPSSRAICTWASERWCRVRPSTQTRSCSRTRSRDIDATNERRPLRSACASRRSATLPSTHRPVLPTRPCQPPLENTSRQRGVSDTAPSRERTEGLQVFLVETYCDLFRAWGTNRDVEVLEIRGKLLDAVTHPEVALFLVTAESRNLALLCRRWVLETGRHEHQRPVNAGARHTAMVCKLSLPGQARSSIVPTTSGRRAADSEGWRPLVGPGYDARRGSAGDGSGFAVSAEKAKRVTGLPEGRRRSTAAPTGERERLQEE